MPIPSGVALLRAKPEVPTADENVRVFAVVSLAMPMFVPAMTTGSTTAYFEIHDPVVPSVVTTNPALFACDGKPD